LDLYGISTVQNFGCAVYILSLYMDGDGVGSFDMFFGDLS